MTETIKSLIKSSSRILITSHVSPDPDAASSVLLLGTTLAHNFPNKQIEMVLEEEVKSLNFLSGFDQLRFEPLALVVTEFRPDLFIMVDAMNVGRCTRRGEKATRKYLMANKTPQIIIDHHQKLDMDKAEAALISQSISAAQDVYELCFKQLKLKKPGDYAQTALTGIYADSGGFVYPNSGYKRTLEIVSELVTAGGNIEAIKNQLDQYTEDQMRVIAELAVNLSHGKDFTYTFISDEFAEKWKEYDKSSDQLRMACKQFIDTYIRNVEGRHWGFMVYPDVLEGENYYSVSLRSMGDARDVSKIAFKLGGGGHKPAAGAKVQATSVQDTIERVKETIAQTD